MQKTQLMIKDNITFQDKVNAIELIADSYFTADDKEQDLYTPYLTEIAQIEAIAAYFLDGITFEKDENIYESILADKEVTGLINCFYPGDESFNQEHALYQNLFRFVLSCAAEKVSFRKEQEVAKLQNQQLTLLSNKLLDVLEKEAANLEVQTENQALGRQVSQKYADWLDYQNKVAEQFTPEEYAALTRDMSDMKFDPDMVTNMLADKYFSSELQKQSEQLAEARQTIAKQNAEIDSLQNEYAKQQDQADS